MPLPGDTRLLQRGEQWHLAAPEEATWHVNGEPVSSGRPLAIGDQLTADAGWRGQLILVEG
jgi:hypothetical protein